MTKNGGPAFPYPLDSADRRMYGSGGVGNGMSLRDYFAAKALPIVAPGNSPASTTVHWFIRPEAFDQLARDAYALADAMLAAREKS